MYLLNIEYWLSSDGEVPFQNPRGNATPPTRSLPNRYIKAPLRFTSQFKLISEFSELSDSVNHLLQQMLAHDCDRESTDMDVDRDVSGDSFLAFVEYARSVLSPEPEETGCEQNDRGEEPVGPGWSWIAGRILRTCMGYSSGVTAAILLSDLSQVRIVRRRARDISKSRFTHSQS